jgi:hypothetical protein
MFTRPRVLLAVLSGGLVAILLFAGPASARSYSTKVIVKSPPEFYGELKSPKSYCRYGRPVRLYIEQPGPDELIYTDTTDSSGEWSMPIGTPPTPGSYYVQVSPTGRCKPAKSRVITI